MLFAPIPQPTTDSGDKGEEDPFALVLDDETQYRCAGYIQAEIERFAELLEDDAARAGTPSKRGSDDEQASGEDEDDNNGRSKSKEKEKTAQRKKSQKREGNVRPFWICLRGSRHCSGYGVSFMA